MGWEIDQSTAASLPIVGKAARTRPRQRERTLAQQIWRERTAYLLILPAFLGYLVFWTYPVLFAFVASFAKYDNLQLVWRSDIFYNYARAFRDPTVRQAFLNVVRYTSLTLGVGQVLALTLALALNSLRRGTGTYRTIYYIPVVTSVVAVATIFRWLFGSDAFGPANLLLNAVMGLGPVRWLWEPKLVIPIIALVSIWMGLGFNAIIWMAGLKAIPPEFYEAARIDGASNWRQFWSITLPLLKPVTVFQVVMGFIGSMKEFGLVLTITDGGPGGASMTPVLMIYKYGFTRLQMGYASALAFLLTLVLIAATVLQFRLYGKTETYE